MRVRISPIALDFSSIGLSSFVIVVFYALRDFSRL
uniref:Uncharacterized protein n=1 Tax=Manihot esculenta TaxID=3983 RepID=A0A2C9ULU9_MANES